MRPDFEKVITERPRYGSHFLPNINDRRRDRVAGNINNDIDRVDSMPVRSAMRRRHDIDALKQFSDLVSPLEKYFEKQVGRNWNDIYSDVRKNIRFDSTTQRHILEHVNSIVTKSNEIEWVNGVLCWKAPTAFGAKELSTFRDVLYVDPRDNILKRQKAKIIKYAKPEKTFIEIEKDVYYAKRDGSWKIIWLDDTEKNMFTSKYGGVYPYDYFLGRTVDTRTRDYTNFYTKLGKFCYKIRDVSKRDLKVIREIVNG